MAWNAADSGSHLQGVHAPQDRRGRQKQKPRLSLPGIRVSLMIEASLDLDGRIGHAWH